MKKTIYYAAIFLFCSAAVSASNSNGIITLLEPSVTATRNKLLVISGRVETPAIKQVNISVEPFTLKGNEKPQVLSASVINGYFNEKVELSPGINLIKVNAGSSGKNEITQPVFLIAQQKKESVGEWGSQAQLVFTAPEELKTNKENITIKGVVTNPNIASVDAVIMNTMYFLFEGSGKENEGKIEYKSVSVKNMQFEIKAKLTQGLNVILARPDRKTAPVEKIQIMSLVYEKISNQVILDEPQLEKGNVIIKGKVSNNQIKKVRLNITALVENEFKPGQLAPRSLLDTNVQVDKDGSFYFKAPLQDKKGIFSIKYSPTITVFTEGASATKTLIKWQ